MLVLAGEQRCLLYLACDYDSVCSLIPGPTSTNSYLVLYFMGIAAHWKVWTRSPNSGQTGKCTVDETSSLGEGSISNGFSHKVSLAIEGYHKISGTRKRKLNSPETPAGSLNNNQSQKLYILQTSLCFVDLKLKFLYFKPCWELTL